MYVVWHKRDGHNSDIVPWGNYAKKRKINEIITDSIKDYIPVFGLLIAVM